MYLSYGAITVSYEPFPRIGFQITKEPNSTDDLPSKEENRLLIQWPPLSLITGETQGAVRRNAAIQGGDAAGRRSLRSVRKPAAAPPTSGKTVARSQRATGRLGRGI